MKVSVWLVVRHVVSMWSVNQINLFTITILDIQ